MQDGREIDEDEERDDEEEQGMEEEEEDGVPVVASVYGVRLNPVSAYRQRR